MKNAPMGVFASVVMAGFCLFLFQNCGPAQLNSDSTAVSTSEGAADQGSSSSGDPLPSVPGSEAPPSSGTNPPPSTSAPTPTPSPTPVAGPQVSYSVSSLDFGRVFLGSFNFRSVTVSNMGQEVLMISRIRINQFGFSFETSTEVDSCRSSLNPGATCRIWIDFSPQEFGTIMATLSITTNAKAEPDSIALVGVGYF